MLIGKIKIYFEKTGKIVKKRKQMKMRKIGENKDIRKKGKKGRSQ